VTCIILSTRNRIINKDPKLYSKATQDRQGLTGNNKNQQVKRRTNKDPKGTEEMKTNNLFHLLAWITGPKPISCDTLNLFSLSF
jgi:hypothetical protein